MMSMGETMQEVGEGPAARPGGAGVLARRALAAARAAPAWPALALLLAASVWLQPRALTAPFLFLVLRQAAPLGIAAIGQGMTIIGRSIDLSVGGVIALVNVVLASRWMGDQPAWASLAVPLGIGLAVGLANGLLVAVRRASAVIVTLGMSIVLVGLSYVVSGGAPGGQVDPLVRWLAVGRIEGVPVAGLVWLGALALAALALHGLVFGRVLYALGANWRAARLCGLPAATTLVTAHAASGALAALSGVILTGYIGTGTLNLGGDLVLASVAACILGGVTFGGGRGNVLGAVAGALALVFLGNLLTGLGAPEPVKLVVQGAIVALAAALAIRR